MKVNKNRKMLFMTCGNVSSAGTTGVNVNVMLWLSVCAIFWKILTSVSKPSLHSDPIFCRLGRSLEKFFAYLQCQSVLGMFLQTAANLVFVQSTGNVLVKRAVLRQVVLQHANDLLEAGEAVSGVDLKHIQHQLFVREQKFSKWIRGDKRQQILVVDGRNNSLRLLSKSWHFDTCHRTTYVAHVVQEQNALLKWFTELKRVSTNLFPFIAMSYRNVGRGRWLQVISSSFSEFHVVRES